MINLETLYPVVVGGGVTNLAEPYTPHVSTSITVVDSSQLNPAPNYLSLMTSDKTIVITVKYQIKEGNTFKQLTIIEGTPGAETHVFGTDTEVLRPICKVDMDDIAENLDLLNSGKQDTIDSTHKLNADYVSDGTNNKVYTSTEKTKLSGIETGAQVNKIESIKANGSVLSIVDKAVDIPVATENAAGLLYQTRSRYNVYVSPTGSDTTGDGTQSKPWRTVLKAIKTIQSLNIPADYYTINIEEGEYEFTEKEIGITRNIEFVVNGDVLFNLSLTAEWAYLFSVRENAKIIIVGRASTDTLTMEYTGGGTTSEEYAFAFRQGSLYISNINVINKFKNGIFFPPISAPTPRRLVSRNNLIISNTGKLTLEKGRVVMQYGIIQSSGDITYGNGTKHEVLQLHHGTIASVKSITGTYSIDSSSVLSIGGHWVNQRVSQYHVYVSPDGDDDTGDGTQSNPWREIQTAITKTNNVVADLIYIHVAPGDYYNQVYPTSHKYVYEMRMDGDTTLHNNMIISSCTVVVSASVQGIRFTIDTTEEKGVSLYFGGSLFVSPTYFDIKCSKYGIYAGGQTGTGTRHTGMKNNFRSFTTTITLTSSNGVGVSVDNFPTDYFRLINSLTVNGVSGTAIIVGPGNLCVCGPINTNLTQYIVRNGGVLSINGQWVGQSGGGGGGVWGQITGDINTQTDLTSFVNNKPTILSGTSEPTPEQGKAGDIYVRYNV